MALNQLVATGSFTSDGTAENIALRPGFDSMEVVNLTQAATTQTPGRGIEFKWQDGFASDSAYMVSKADGDNTVTHEVVTSGGFTKIDTSVQAPEAAKAMSGTEIAKATSVVTVTAHGYSVGDRVRIYSTTDMLQVAGIEATISAVPDANSFTLGYIDMSGFADDASGGSVRRIPNNPLFTPSYNYITKITKAASAVVTLSLTHGLSVGDVIRLTVPSEFGMVEADKLQGTITAVSTANNTVTLDINSTAFTTFAFPTSAIAAGGVTFAQAIPVGTTLQNVSNATENQAQIIMKLAAGVDSPAGSSGDVIYWKSFKAAN